LNAPAEAAHLSIVVLPFTNLSGDASQDYFADGITEKLTTDLSRIRNSFVIARNTAFTFKGKTIDAKEIGKELGVRYVLEGSVQRDQNRVRINAQLIDAQSGAHLWADRFEEDIADLFKLQDQVVARLANSLGNELIKAEGERGGRSKNPDATDLTLRGMELLSQAMQKNSTKDNVNPARTLFEQALQIDPNDAAALAGDATTYFSEYLFGWGDSQTDYDAKVLGQAERAIAIAPDYMFAHRVKSYYLASTQRFNEAFRAAHAGLAINPNYPDLYAARGSAEISLGRFEQAKFDLRQAMRLSPRDPRIGLWHAQFGDAEIAAGNVDASIVEYENAYDVGHRPYWTYANLAAAHALQGKMDEAKSELAEALRLNPKLTVKWFRVHSEDIPARVVGLRKVGLPEE